VEITAEEAGSRITTLARLPASFRALETPIAIPAVPTAAQKPSSAPPVCSSSSRPIRP